MANTITLLDVAGTMQMNSCAVYHRIRAKGEKLSENDKQCILKWMESIKEDLTLIEQELKHGKEKRNRTLAGTEAASQSL
jgi:hypothetical protein